MVSARETLAGERSADCTRALPELSPEAPFSAPPPPARVGAEWAEGCDEGDAGSGRAAERGSKGDGDGGDGDDGDPL